MCFFNLSSSHRPQYFMNSFSAGPFHRAQSVKSRFIQCRSLTMLVFKLSHHGPGAGGEPLLRNLKHLLLLHLHWCLQDCCSFIFLSSGYCFPKGSLFTLLNYMVTQVLPLLLMTSAMTGVRSVLEYFGIISVKLTRSLWHLLNRSHPCSLPATKTLSCMQKQYRSSTINRVRLYEFIFNSR